MFVYSICFALSLIASTIGAVSGIGGGVIIKPVMDALALFEVSTISFLSGTTVLSMTTVSLLKNRRSGIQIDKKRSTLLALGSVMGGVTGKYLFDFCKTQFVNEAYVGAAQAAVLLLLTIGVLGYNLFSGKIKGKNTENPFVCILLGFLLANFSSFLGIGGGPINLVVLYYFFSMDAKTAAMNSIYIIFFSQLASLLFGIVAGSIPAFPPIALVTMIAGGIGGGFAGSYALRKLSNERVSKLFAVVLAIIIAICVFNLVRYLL